MYKWLFGSIVLYVLLFNIDKLLLNTIVIITFSIGYFFYYYKNFDHKKTFDDYLNGSECSNRTKKSLFNIDLNEYTFETIQQKQQVNLTGSKLIDDELVELIELFVHDFIESWYKVNISSRDEFCKEVRQALYQIIRQLSVQAKNVDWEQFILSALSNDVVTHMRIFKKSKEKLNQLHMSNNTNNSNNNTNSNSNGNSSSSGSLNGNNNQNNSTNNNSNNQNSLNDENSLIEIFFDIEAELEKSICRDEICHNSNGKELEYLQELCELLCYLVLPSTDFNCGIFRCIIRETLAHLVAKESIDIVSDPDYINQTMQWLLKSQPIQIENFLITIQFDESIDELSEIKLKIEDELLVTRSQDKGGQKDHEIKLRLSSLKYLKQRIEQKINYLILNSNNYLINSHSPQSSFNDDEFNRQYPNYSIDFDVALGNEMIQHCFIEYMGGNNAQYLISFYLNAQMYFRFAKKELESQKPDTKLALQDFAKGLINSYLMNHNMAEDLTNVSNIIYYKDELNRTLERMQNPDLIDEYLLYNLQLKIYALMKQKYYPEFKQSIEFHKLISKNESLIKLLNQSASPDEYTTSFNSEFLDSESQQMMNSIGSIESHSLSVDHYSNTADRVSQSSLDLSNDSNDFNLFAIITNCGRCNELKSQYAIYIIDVKKVFENSAKNEYWQTYRRFNDFHDLHLTIKKKFPQLNHLVLPGKSLRSSLNEEFLEKRRHELNRYLQTLCNPHVITNNPGLLSFVLKFLENKRWQNSQTNFTRRIDSLFTPVLSSVQNIQATIKNAPDNVIGIVKGLSDNILTNADSNNKTKSTTANGSNNGASNNDYACIERATIDETSNNFSLRVLLVAMDEIFDLKEKNQWLRQSLITIIKGFLKSFKGNSMNRKIKEHIADYLSEENISLYLKRIKKRFWPKGLLADPVAQRSKAVKDITKVLTKTKLLALVSDELKTILSSDTTRRGLFNLFEMFQYKALNKRLVYVLFENLILTLFQQQQQNSKSSASASTSTMPPLFTNNQQLTLYMRNYLTKSNRVKSEWKQQFMQQQQQQQLLNFAKPPQQPQNGQQQQQQQQQSSTPSQSSIPKSKSVHSYIQC